MLHKMKLLESPFQEMVDGNKDIEFRLYDDKRRMVKKGDVIEFSKLPDLEEKINMEVIDLYPYPTFKELLSFLGYTGEELEEKTKSMYSIYTKNQEKEYGVLGIKVRRIK